MKQFILSICKADHEVNASALVLTATAKEERKEPKDLSDVLIPRSLKAILSKKAQVKSLEAAPASKPAAKPKATSKKTTTSKKKKRVITIDEDEDQE